MDEGNSSSGSGSKREHSGEDLPYAPQNKVHLSERLVNERDAAKMQEIHARTQQLLFQGANSAMSNEEGPSGSRARLPPFEHFSISANGEMMMRNFTRNERVVEMRRLNASCCSRQSYISADCADCTLPLCEFCGYSCSECGTYLCAGCVSLFGCGTREKPMCEKCAMFKN